MRVDLWPNIILCMIRYGLNDSAVVLTIILIEPDGQYHNVIAIRYEHFTIVEYIAAIHIFSSLVQSPITEY